MTTFRDIPADMLLPVLADRLADMDGISAPEWANHVKTGIHRERPPSDDNWWMMRSAAVLRKVARHGPIGTTHLAQAFGGKVNRNSAPNRAGQASRKVVRTCLIQLEDCGLVEKVVNKEVKNIDDETQVIYSGRVITPAGHKLLDDVAREMRSQAEESYPFLTNY